MLVLVTLIAALTNGIIAPSTTATPTGTSASAPAVTYAVDDITSGGPD